MSKAYIGILVATKAQVGMVIHGIKVFINQLKRKIVILVVQREIV